MVMIPSYRVNYKCSWPFCPVSHQFCTRVLWFAAVVTQIINDDSRTAELCRCSGWPKNVSYKLSVSCTKLHHILLIMYDFFRRI